MDTEISQQVLNRRKKKIYFFIFLALVFLAILVLFLRNSLSADLSKKLITTAVVEKGDVENTLNASGEVIPEFEEVITSPISASIQKVLFDAGASIKSGESILTLDKAATGFEVEKLKFQLESKRNSIHKLKLELDKSFFDIQSNNDIKQLRINSLQAAVENAKRLYKAGGGTREDIEQAELNLKVAQLEKKQLENEIRNKQQTMQADMRESEIAADIQQNELQVLERKLTLANIVASRSGVVTWVNKNIGASVREGESLARIADLSSFKVQGSISDNYIDQLHLNMPVIVRINDVQLRGTVSNISPAIVNRVVSFDVQLNERNNKLLRPNMKVDVYPVTARHSDVLRVVNGPALKGSSAQDIFVLANGKAQRRPVHLGMMNFDYVEILDQVKAGEVVITSDMSEFKQAKEITVHE